MRPRVTVRGICDATTGIFPIAPGPHLPALYFEQTRFHQPRFPLQREMRLYTAKDSFPAVDGTILPLCLRHVIASYLSTEKVPKNLGAPAQGFSGSLLEHAVGPRLW